MAKKNVSLTFRDIVLGAEADVIRQALAAREQIDQLVVERERAYAQIAALEAQVEDVLGETGVFPFPAPPLPVAGFDPKAATVTRSAAAVEKAVEAALVPSDDEVDSDTDETAGTDDTVDAATTAETEVDDEEPEAPAPKPAPKKKA